jgi:hypothetical protein
MFVILIQQQEQGKQVEIPGVEGMLTTVGTLATAVTTEQRL